jgi:arylsulfatase
MIENLDDNFAVLLKKLKDWRIEDNTLVIFLTDNGGTFGVNVYNAGMRGSKATPYEGGTRVPSFWRWPAAFKGGLDCDALTAHIDIFPTLAEIAGAKLSRKVKHQVEGRSLLPLLKNPKALWPDRFLVTHVGRWPRGQAAEWKFKTCCIRDRRFALVNNSELYDLKTDPGETKDFMREYPEVVAKLRVAYDKWWNEVMPRLKNEDASGPKINPFKALYWKQFGGGPDAALLRQMDPDLADRERTRQPGRTGATPKNQN